MRSLWISGSAPGIEQPRLREILGAGNIVVEAGARS